MSQRVREAPLKSDNRSDDGADSGSEEGGGGDNNGDGGDGIGIDLVQLPVVQNRRGIVKWRKMGSLKFYGFQLTEGYTRRQDRVIIL